MMKNKYLIRAVHVDLHIHELCSMKKVLNASAKSINPGQPALSGQTDLGRNFLLLISFQRIKGPYYFMIYSVNRTRVWYWFVGYFRLFIVTSGCPSEDC